jgi:hypothetical protein
MSTGSPIVIYDLFGIGSITIKRDTPACSQRCPGAVESPPDGLGAVVAAAYTAHRSQMFDPAGIG